MEHSLCLLKLLGQITSSWKRQLSPLLAFLECPLDLTDEISLKWNWIVPCSLVQCQLMFKVIDGEWILGVLASHNYNKYTKQLWRHEEWENRTVSMWKQHKCAYKLEFTQIHIICSPKNETSVIIYPHVISNQLFFSYRTQKKNFVDCHWCFKASKRHKSMKHLHYSHYIKHVLYSKFADKCWQKSNFWVNCPC